MVALSPVRYFHDGSRSGAAARSRGAPGAPSRGEELLDAEMAPLAAPLASRSAEVASRQQRLRYDLDGGRQSPFESDDDYDYDSCAGPAGEARLAGGGAALVADIISESFGCAPAGGGRGRKRGEGSGAPPLLMPSAKRATPEGVVDMDTSLVIVQPPWITA